MLRFTNAFQCVAAVFSDMFDNRTRGMAITIFSMTVFTGPLLSPFIGGFIIMSYLGWRWTMYLIAIMGFTAFTLNLLFLEESYPPEILVQKASELRRRTKNWGIHAKQEEIEIDFRELLEKNFSRPLRMLFTEPIVLLLSIYMAFIYGLLYLFLTAYPLVFQGVHGMNLGVGGLPFIGMVIGQLIAGTLIFIRQPGYNRKLTANNNVPIPEWRLPEVIVGGAAFAAGIFWFGWTGYNQNIHWIVPTIAGILIGFGLLSIFLQALNYLVDAYLMVRFRIPFSCILFGHLLTLTSVRRLRHCCKHVLALPLRCRLPALRPANVQRYGHPVGVHAAGLYRRRTCPRACVVLPQGRQDQAEERIRAYVRCSTAEDGEGAGLNDRVRDPR